MIAHRAYVHDETAHLFPYVTSGCLVASDVQVARAVARRLHETDPLVLLAVALSVRAVREGQVCLLLDRVNDVALSGDSDRDGASAPALPPVDEWVRRLSASAVVHVAGFEAPASPRPLVLDGDRLYLDRYWCFELVVARQLLDRAGARGGLFDDQFLVEARADGYFGAEELRDPQRLAIFRALTRPLTVISGGPGTGKTRTIAQLLHQAQSFAELSDKTLKPALAAPTATAAKRMTLALQQESKTGETGETAPGTSTVISTLQATTLHRLLGVDSTGGFIHNRRNPLAHDLVVVDEASMVSLPLFARLLEAVRPEASLVLVGDPFQLESVEAGAVLGEIVGNSLERRQDGAIDETIVHLERQHRFRLSSPLAKFADAIRTGQTDKAIEILATARSEELQWIRNSEEEEVLSHRVAASAIAVIDAARRGDAKNALEILADLKIICATRHGLRGVQRWSSRVEQLVKIAHPEFIGDNAWYIGRPIIVNRNDYLNRLFNGDSGVVVDLGKPTAVFSEASEVRSVPLARLREIDTWWAMTIHKSQGAEFENVIVSLPEPPSPVLSRELLYTAVTRAKRSVSIVASEESLRAAIGHPSERFSGLSARLRVRTS